MSDRRLRELERTWREARSPSAEAAYLLERVRMGELTRDGLEWAAFCGREGARWAVGAPVVPLPGWLASLDRLQGRRRIVAHAACGRVVYRLLVNNAPGDRRPLSLLEAVEAWLQRPDRRATRRIAELLDGLVDFQERLDWHLRRTLGGHEYTYGADGLAVILCFLVVHEAGSSVARLRAGHADPDVGLFASLDERLRDAGWNGLARAIPVAVRRALLEREPGLDRL